MTRMLCFLRPHLAASALIAGAALLGGCASGTGNGSPTTPLTPTTPVTPTPTPTPTTPEATLDRSLSGQSISLTAPLSRVPTASAMTTSDGNPITADYAYGTQTGKLRAMQARISGTMEAIEFGSPTTVLPTGRLSQDVGENTSTGYRGASNLNATGTFTIAMVDRDAADGTNRLKSARYGLISIVDPANNNRDYLTAYHVGSLTPLNQMPSNVTATYTGLFRGIHEVAGTAGHRVGEVDIGTVNLTANFTNGTIKGSVNNMVDGGGQPLFYGLHMDGRIAGNTYKGTVELSQRGGAPVAGSATGSSWNGAFYGPNAAETAGALAVRGTVPNGVTTPANTGYIIGGYGARRQ